VTLTGVRFKGISQASGGTGQDSSSNYPVVQLRALGNEQVAFLDVDPTSGWSDTSFTSVAVSDFPGGPALVTVFTNGIPSDARYIRIGASNPGTLQFTTAAQSVGESGGNVTVTVRRADDSAGAVSVNYATANGSATAGADYTPASGTLTWADGDTADKSFTVTILEDNIFEGSETFSVGLSAPDGGAILGTPAIQTVTITDNDSQPTPPVVALNISTRAKIETDDNAMIAGFIITGTAPKKVAIRGLGPSLQDTGVVGFVADPVLELHGSNTSLTFANDNWQHYPTQAAQLEAVGLAPKRTEESAIVITLDPGLYTAVLRGKNNTAGVGVVEVYDIDNAQSELANLSTRSFVQLEDNVMIGGFILGAGNGTTDLVLRALGPSLANAGINNPLADPTLDVRNAYGTQIGFNDNWKDDPADAARISAKGLAPSNNSEPAIPLALSPGQYTSIVRGKDNGTGIALIEIYNFH
jgi:hypothetical protein